MQQAAWNAVRRARAQILSKTMDSTTLTPDKVELSTLAVNASTGLVRPRLVCSSSVREVSLE